ncbi:hypothetical protein E1292_50605, partial [Nonomuraea deserti]
PLTRRPSPPPHPPAVGRRLERARGETAPVGPRAGAPPPVNAGPVNPGPVNPGPVNPGPVNPGPVNPGPVNPGPVNPGPVSRTVLPRTPEASRHIPSEHPVHRPIAHAAAPSRARPVRTLSAEVARRAPQGRRHADHRTPRPVRASGRRAAPHPLPPRTTRPVERPATPDTRPDRRAAIGGERQATSNTRRLAGGGWRV